MRYQRQPLNPFYHTIGSPTSIRPNFPLYCRFFSQFVFAAFRHPYTHTRTCIHAHLLPFIHSLSKPADSIGLTTEQLICQNSIIDFICSMRFSPFIFHRTHTGRASMRAREKIPSIRSCANGQLLFRLIHLILCFGIFGSLHFRAVNFRLKS